mmetsp:Transcript_16132/g.33080  ORF Transcript_16132/g.33080 Transcript_16132/m.33080 type:complete len:347 (-) Transcript_16132:103-1143(-)|eukprot:CAMPEP_0118667064 /NCGR_PEP_ID=MMETSP0785-20121206/19573_1 /TAXON_ID=91992 /ORGANISM="Bolidomonas pacifica, Strain CCMP 1866" /LENGTH=346 /DNA_ID=CAMNT_0006561465 /DNA_START=16 /DNA_END=1056 /DNA_ORIENTATION=-
MFKLIFLSLLAQSAFAHVTLNPNYGAGSGGYFKTSLKIPHGTHGKETTKVKVTVPHGVLSAVPEALHGWDITINTRDIQPYVSHGNTVSTAPAEIIWEATCTGANAPASCNNDDHAGLDHSHLLELELQVKFGCDFGIDKDGNAQGDATIWMGEYTLWWNTEQHVSTPGTNDGNTDGHSDTLSWVDQSEGSESWGGMHKVPSPYTFVYSTDACQPDSNSGSNSQSGMRWGASSEVIPVAVDQEAVKNKAEVLSWMEEQALTTEETWNTKFAEHATAIEDAKSEAENSALVAMIAAAISTLLLLVVFLTVSCRVANPNGFRKVLLSDAYVVNPGDEYNKAQIGDNAL